MRRADSEMPTRVIETLKELRAAIDDVVAEYEGRGEGDTERVSKRLAKAIMRVNVYATGEDAI